MAQGHADVWVGMRSHTHTRWLTISSESNAIRRYLLQSTPTAILLCTLYKACLNNVWSQWPNWLLLCKTAGFFTLLLTNPLWVAKTRLCLQYNVDSAHTKSLMHSTSISHSSVSPHSACRQIEIKYYRGMIDCLRSTYRSEGVRGLYKVSYLRCARTIRIYLYYYVSTVLY